MTTGTTTVAGAPESAAATTGAAQQRTPLWSRTWVRIAGGFIVPIIILAAWQFVTATGIVPPYRLPGPDRKSVV